jgi:hypothetical protein
VEAAAGSSSSRSPRRWKRFGNERRPGLCPCRPLQETWLTFGAFRLPILLRLRNRCGMSAVQAHHVPDRDWMDELVELHVLAASGDTAAASAAERWMATDPAVRKAWMEVENTCDRVRGAEKALPQTSR